MKALLIIALLAAPIYGATNEEIEAQIIALQSTLERQKADSTVAVYEARVQSDAAYATLKDAGITIVNAPHLNGNYDSQWIGISIPDSLGITADEKNAAIALIKQQYKGQDSPDADVRIRKDRHADVMAVLKLFAE